MQIEGHEIGEATVERIRCRVREDATLTRTGLSREVAGWLDWRDGRGRLREMSCRVALLKLARRGAIELPPARPDSFAPAQEVAPAELSTIETTLAALGPIDLERVTDRAQARRWRALMAHHPLGAGPLCGAQLRYLVRAGERDLGALSFSAPARRLAARESFIGWNEGARRAHLQRVVNNSRFLILPSVKVPHLASHILGMAARRVVHDWQSVYGIRPMLLETFVDPDHQGTCYRAAGWTEIGQTSGRGRQDRHHQVPCRSKRIFVRPLSRHWRGALTGSHEPPPAAAPAMAAPADWAEREFGAARLPDVRLGRRLLSLARDFYAHPSAPVPQACGSRAKTKAAYRFFSHSNMPMRDLLSGHYQATAERMQSEPVVLAVQDTTSLNYTAHPETDGLGPISHRAHGRGLELHSTLAFTPSGVPLGLLDVQCWARDPNDFGKKARRHQIPIAAKESSKWLNSYQATAAGMPDGATQVVSVGDREADLYDLFEMAQRTKHGPRLLVRARHNRALRNEQQRLWPTLQAQPVAGQLELAVPRRGSRKARTAHLQIRHAKVHLKAPVHHAPDAPTVPVWTVLATERDAPEGVKPLEWMLLSTVAVSDTEQAVEKLQWYAQRWGIEVFHRTLKSGCRIEDRQLARADRLEACLAIDLVVAWRIQRLTKLARQMPDAPCTTYFEEPQWRALMVFTEATEADTPPTLREGVRRVAALGGFLGRKSDHEPGTQTLWRGLQRLDDIAKTYSQTLRATHLSVSSHDSG